MTFRIRWRQGVIFQQIEVEVGSSIIRRQQSQNVSWSKLSVIRSYGMHQWMGRSCMRIWSQCRPIFSHSTYLSIFGQKVNGQENIPRVSPSLMPTMGSTRFPASPLSLWCDTSRQCLLGLYYIYILISHRQLFSIQVGCSISSIVQRSSCGLIPSWCSYMYLYSSVWKIPCRRINLMSPINDMCTMHPCWGFFGVSINLYINLFRKDHVRGNLQSQIVFGMSIKQQCNNNRCVFISRLQAQS